MDFLRGMLSEGFVADALQRAAAKLEGQPEGELARRVEKESSDRTELISKRCKELPDMLAAATSPLEWFC